MRQVLSKQFFVQEDDETGSGAKDLLDKVESYRIYSHRSKHASVDSLSVV